MKSIPHPLFTIVIFALSLAGRASGEWHAAAPLVFGAAPPRPVALPNAVPGEFMRHVQYDIQRLDAEDYRAREDATASLRRSLIQHPGVVVPELRRVRTEIAKEGGSPEVRRRIDGVLWRVDDGQLRRGMRAELLEGNAYLQLRREGNAIDSIMRNVSRETKQRELAEPARQERWKTALTGEGFELKQQTNSHWYSTYVVKKDGKTYEVDVMKDTGHVTGISPVVPQDGQFVPRELTLGKEQLGAEWLAAHQRESLPVGTVSYHPGSGGEGRLHVEALQLPKAEQKILSDSVQKTKLPGEGMRYERTYEFAVPPPPAAGQPAEARAVLDNPEPGTVTVSERVGEVPKRTAEKKAELE